jgi:hypothetical protein
MHFTPLDLETSLFDHLRETVVAGLALKKAQFSMSRLTGKTHETLYWSEAVKGALRTWLTPYCKTITQESAGGTGMSFTVDSLPQELREINIRAYDFEQCLTEDEIQNAIALLFKKADYSFSELANIFQETCGTLETQGHTKIADSIADKFGFIHYDLARSRAFFKQTHKHIQFEKSLRRPDYGRYDYREREKFFCIAKELAFIEYIIGPSGLAKPFEILSQMLEQEGDCSGQTIGHADSVQIKVFNKHVRISMTPSVMDGLMSFIYIHKSKNLILKAINHDQQLVA